MATEINQSKETNQYKEINQSKEINQCKETKRVGIIGNGRIAGRFLAETAKVDGFDVQGVYNPHTDSARQFAVKNGIRLYETLSELYENTDIIYVAAPHQTHYGYVKDALEQGKHVICEKPLALRGEEARELFGIACERGRILSEGIKTAYCPGFLRLIGVARSGKIGSIRYLDACFTKLENEEKRELTDLKYGGSFTELASYCLLPIVKLFGAGYRDLEFSCVRNEKGLDLFTRATLTYEKGFASASCGLGVKAEGRLLIAGTKGYIVAEAPWWKTTSFEVHFEDPGKVEKYTEEFSGDGLQYEIRDFLNRIAETDRIGRDDRVCGTDQIGRDGRVCGTDRIAGNGGEWQTGSRLAAEESIAMAGIIEKFLQEEHRG